MAKSKVEFETVRTLAFGGISGTYAAVGTASTAPTRIICFSNGTDAPMYFSHDGTNDYIFVAAGSFKLFDLTTNHRPVNQDDFVIVQGTQWYVKQISAPTSGSVYIEMVYAE